VGPAALDKLADAIGGAEAAELRKRFAQEGKLTDDRAIAVGTLLACAYPSLRGPLLAHPGDVAAVAKAGLRARDAKTLRRAALVAVEDLADADAVRSKLRVFARREKLRIALRELLPGAANDLDLTARELSDLADACTDVALREALAWADARFGIPRNARGERCAFVVIGMGKLGGRELNAGSDIDLLLFYETDDGDVQGSDAVLHEYFVRVTQRLTAMLDEPTEDGFVFRVDLRLRPEGSRGPLVNALAAAERYYEAWGRTWERAALVRARPIAGDIAFGEEVLAALGPFVWRRVVNPALADEMGSMLLRSRTEAKGDVERDLKLGPGGIREAEFFVQTLQLVWGGREPSIRGANTLDALRRLRSRGLVTDREARELEAAYLALRRLEHRVQFATGLQTHTLPHEPTLLYRIARSLGYASAVEMQRDLDKTRRRVASRFASLSASQSRPSEPQGTYDRLWLALESGREADVLAALPPDFPDGVSPDLGRHLLALARRPDGPLGSQTRDRQPEFAAALTLAIGDAADPEQAARLLASFFGRLLTPSVYVRALADDARAMRRVVNLLGSSAYLGESAVRRLELFDRLIFTRDLPSAASARETVADEVEVVDKDDPDDLVGGLRKAKGRVVLEVGLADLSGELDSRACTTTLSALADAILAEALAFALREKNLAPEGLAILGMGKLGGRELGYGSDLDIIFVYDEDAIPEAQERFIRVGQRVLFLLSVPHGAGQGYELDTRLRPSGNQGLLVVSLGSFRRYHEGEAADWERQALIKARHAAGDPALARRSLEIAQAAAYERGAPAAEKLHHLRLRMQRELAGERLDQGRVRYDLKLGRGGLVDIEFAVQWLQMKFGRDPRVRTTETETAIASLEACGYLDPQHATVFRDGYRTLRQLELRLRVHHGTGSQWLEEGAPGLVPLARRVGMRDGPRGTAGEALLEHYRAVTREVRASYLAVLGLQDDEAQGVPSIR
jgi:glutamate-ammonia-ligase adenylyltransferase